MTWSQQQTDADLLTYLRMLAGNPQRDQFFDMRYLRPRAGCANGSSRRFASTSSHA